MISIQSLSRFLAVLPLGLAFSSIVIAPVKATTLISNIVNTTSDPANTNVCADTGICSPGDTLDLVTGTPPRIVNNDTGFPITDILYIIAPNQDAVWDLATSESDIFEITIFNNGTTMLLHNGAIAPNQVVFANRIAMPQLPGDPDAVSFSFTINSGVTVPEPSLIFGLIGFGIFGVAGKLEKK